MAEIRTPITPGEIAAEAVDSLDKASFVVGIPRTPAEILVAISETAQLKLSAGALVSDAYAWAVQSSPGVVEELGRAVLTDMVIKKVDQYWHG